MILSLPSARGDEDFSADLPRAFFHKVHVGYTCSKTGKPNTAAITLIGC